MLEGHAWMVDKKNLGGGGSSMDDAMPSSLYSALFNLQFPVSRLTIVILDCLDLQFLSC